MLLIFVLLTFNLGLSQFFHEVFGIIIGIAFISHIILNRKMFLALCKTIKKNGIFSLSGLKLTLNILLFISTAIITITGILISNQLFNFNITDNYSAVFHLHKIASYICLAILAVHTLSHFTFIKSVVKQMLTNRKKPEVKRTILGFMSSVFAILIIYSFVFISKSKHDNFINYESSVNGSIQSGDKKNTFSPSKDGSSNDDKGTNSTITENAGEDTPSLQEYLSKLRCTACPKHCFLTSPRCNRGTKQQQEATNDYNQLYLKTE